MGSYLFQSNDQGKTSDEIKEDYFPEELDYEKELMSNFKYFNVLWYSPNNDEDFEEFKIYFKNVRFVKVKDLESAVIFFQKESSSDEWIVVTPGSKGQELIKRLEENKCINAFFVYCMNVEFHRKWTQNIKKVKCLTSNPEILKQKFCELNKNYKFPSFAYSDMNTKKTLDDLDFLFNINDINTDNEYALNSVKREIKNILNNINKSKNEYNNFCIRTIHYLKGKDCLNDFKQPVPDINSMLYHYVKLFKSFNDAQIENIIKFMKNSVYLSLYFNQYKYLLNIYSYNEVLGLFNPKTNKNELSKAETKAISLADKLVKKILNKKSIIEDIYELKEIQKYYILFVFNSFILSNKKKTVNYYQVINFLRDIDFCIKMFIYFNFSKLNNKNYNFVETLFPAILEDERVTNFGIYLDEGENDSEQISEDNKRKIEKSLAIRDFLIMGNKIFKNKIKDIEINLKAKSLKYLNVEDVADYIESRYEKDEIRVYFYYIIMPFENIKKNFDKLILLSAEFGITFIIILYIENFELYKSFIEKKYINLSTMITIILVYSNEDIKKYFSNIKNFNFGINMKEFLASTNSIKSKETIKQNDIEEDCQDGCFELAETFNINIVKNKTILNFDDEVDYSSISDDIYEIYKEHKALDLFFMQNIKYFGFVLEPEFTSMDICFIKRILYMYCREENEHEKSFYRMINDDLRTRDPSKIDRFIILLGLIFKSIENKELASYKGKVYRATKLDENLILKLKPGTKVINTTFWSTSKNFEVAKKFMKNNAWRNAYIICDNVKINIDIDLEDVNPFDEEEVLILPFTEFRIEKIHSENIYGKKIYFIELIDLGNKNLVNYDNMNIEIVNDLTLSKALEQFMFKKKTQ